MVPGSIKPSKTAARNAVPTPILSPINNDSVFDPSGKVPRRDELERGDLAEAIAAMVGGVVPPFTVGVYGAWGTGKTHLMRTVEILVRGPAVRTVWFDLGQQTDVNPIVAMLHQVRSEMPRGSKEWKALGDIISALLPNNVDLALNVPVQNKQWGTGNGVVGNVRDEIRADRQSIQEQKSHLHTLFARALDALADGGRVVFFLDDLDCCLPDVVIDVLEKVKLMAHKQCVFVIGADEAAVRHAVADQKKCDVETASHYLEKIVQYAFYVPPIDPDVDVGYFTSHLTVQQCPLEVIEEIAKLWAVACDEKAASLRLRIQLVNTFAVNDFLAKRRIDENDYDVRILAVITALQVLHPAAYAFLTTDGAYREDCLRWVFVQPEGEDCPLNPTDQFVEVRSSMERLIRAARAMGIGSRLKSDPNLRLSRYAEYSVVSSLIAEPRPAMDTSAV